MPSLRWHLFGIVQTENQSDCWTSLFLTHTERFMDMLQFIHFKCMQTGLCAHGALMDVHMWSHGYMFSPQILHSNLKETAFMIDVSYGEITG